MGIFNREAVLIGKREGRRRIGVVVETTVIVDALASVIEKDEGGNGCKTRIWLGSVQDLK